MEAMPDGFVCLNDRDWVLEHAVDSIRDVHGLIAEIGTRRGGSAKRIIDRLMENKDAGRVMLCIDPYGNIPYFTNERIAARLDYTNEMRDDALADLYAFAREKSVSLFVLVMEDTEFFKRFSDGYPVYNGTKEVRNDYALVYFDGPHDLAVVTEEFEFFNQRARHGAIFAFDDINHYPHDVLEKRMFECGFKRLLRGLDGPYGVGSVVKASYMKLRTEDTQCV